jgi:hypothetical protein
VKIRLWGTEDECRVAVSEPYADHGASVLVRVFVEARLDPPPEVQHVTTTAGSRPRRRDERASALAQRMTQRRALPPEGNQS